MDLSDVTLLILSHNRQHCLIKTLDFYTGTKLNLLVLDNSPSDLDQRFIPVNCRYFNSEESFANRSGQAAKLIQTPYTIIGADDEIYLPSALEKMRDFLDTHPDYVAAGGNAIAVWEYGPIIAASWAYKNTFRYHNEADSAYGRIRIHTGEGSRPMTSFFTCNLVRTSAARNCLNMYAKAPILATDAISVLSICGAGKSKYLDVTYWIRNWNQSPRSHSGWDRRMFLHEWWRDPINAENRRNFMNDLRSIYMTFSQDSEFENSWNLILKSDEVLQHRSSYFSTQFARFSEIPTCKALKYWIKKILKPGSLPSTLEAVSASMKESDIQISERELSKASLIVSQLRPYKNW